MSRHTNRVRTGAAAAVAAAAITLIGGASTATAGPIAPSVVLSSCLSFGKVTIVGAEDCTIAPGETIVITLKGANGGPGGAGGNGGDGGAFFEGELGGIGGVGGGGGIGGSGAKVRYTYTNNTGSDVVCSFALYGNGEPGNAGYNGPDGINGPNEFINPTSGAAGGDGTDGSDPDGDSGFALTDGGILVFAYSGLGGGLGTGGTAGGAGGASIVGTNGTDGSDGDPGVDASQTPQDGVTYLSTTWTEAPFIEFSGPELPITGSSSTVPTMLALGLLVSGMALLAIGRRARTVR